MTSPTQLPTKPARGEGFQGRQGPQWQAVGDVPTGSDRCTQFDSPSAPRQLASSSRRRSCNQSRAADLLVLTPGYAPFRPKLLLELASRAPVEFAPVSGRISRRSKCQQPVQGLPLACKRKPRFPRRRVFRSPSRSGLPGCQNAICRIPASCIVHGQLVAPRPR